MSPIYNGGFTSRSSSCIKLRWKGGAPRGADYTHKPRRRMSVDFWSISNNHEGMSSCRRRQPNLAVPRRALPNGSIE